MYNDHPSATLRRIRVAFPRLGKIEKVAKETLKKPAVNPSSCTPQRAPVSELIYHPFKQRSNECCTPFARKTGHRQRD